MTDATRKTFLLLFIALFLLAVTTMAALAFPQSQLGGASSPPAGTPLTVAGQTNGCSQYADETGVITGAGTITPKSLPALINIYQCINNDPLCKSGWSYVGEYSNTLSYSVGGQYFAWEAYYCPTTPSTCTDGQKKIVTETSYSVCSSGAWGTPVSCPTGQYVDPTSKACTSYACHEQWSCGSWGQCTAGGLQYRSCTDSNSCGTFTQIPAVTQACDPTLSDGATTNSIAGAITLVGQPSIDSLSGKAGEARTVTQIVQVNKPGNYWLEAGLEQYRGFSIVGPSINVNTCNPDETWYANKLVSLPTVGQVPVTFTVTPGSNGEWILHTAVVTGCGGSVVQQSNKVDRIIIGTDPASQSSGQANFWTTQNTVLVIIVLGALLLGAGYYVRRKH